MAEDSQSFLGGVEGFTGLQSEMRIVNELHSSSGGPFRVFVGERMGKKFAIKTLKEELKGDAVYSAMLRKEYEIETDLYHSGIVRAIGFEDIPAFGPSIVQEFVEGERLDCLIKKGALEEKDVVRIVSSLVATISYLHGRRVVHCDLKPANIIISAFDGLPVLIDFGFADSAGYSGWKFKGGTSRYIAPERMEENYELSPGGDIWSLGQIINDLLPFAGKSRKRLAKVAKSCLQPVGKRIVNAEEILQKLKRRNNATIWILLGSSLLIIAVGIVIALNSQKTQDGDKTSAQDTLTQENPALPEVANSPAEDTIPVTSVVNEEEKVVGEEEREEIATQPEDIVSAEETLPPSSLSQPPVVNIEKLSEQYDGVEEGVMSYYSMIADNYARNAAYGMIEKRKAAGLYKKPRTMEEALQSRAVLDSVLNDIKVYVEFLDIPDEEMRQTVVRDAQQVARDIIREEGNKLPWN